MTDTSTDEFRPTWREHASWLFWNRLADLLPRHLVYAAAGRVMSYACTGPHKDQDPHALLFTTALRRWYQD
jgi:hypothetical protein